MPPVAARRSSAPLPSLPTLLLLLLCAVAAPQACAASNATAASAEECRALGFASPVCSDCDTFETMLHDSALGADCRGCCVEDVKEATVLYDKGVIEVCPWYLQGLPELRAFIDKGLDAFPEVTVRQVAGKPPTLRLRQVASGGKGKGKGGKSAAAAADGSDGAKEDVRLDSWKQDHIRDFLKRKLKAHHATATSA